MAHIKQISHTLAILPLCWAVVLSCACAATRPAGSRVFGPTEPNEPRPCQVIRYDAKNSLSYEIPKDTRDCFILKYALNGTSQTWNLTFNYLEFPISTQLVYGIHYTTPERVWLVTHMGRRLGGAVLLNLKTQQIEKGYAFHGPYAISPDGLKLAYAYPNGFHDQSSAVLINKAVIYPAFKLVGKDDTRSFLDTAENLPDDPTPDCLRTVQRVFTWLGDDSFQFIVQETTSGEHGEPQGPSKFIEYTATGLKKAFASQPADLKAIKLVHRELALDEAQKRIKVANQLEIDAYLKRHPQQPTRKQTVNRSNKR